jgi:hypothetical protein
MGLLATRWEANNDGHTIVVSRNEWTKGFTIEWDGDEIARRTWSWIGLGELQATVELDGRSVEVHVALEWAGTKQLDGSCTITVDGQQGAVEQLK